MWGNFTRHHRRNPEWWYKHKTSHYVRRELRKLNFTLVLGRSPLQLATRDAPKLPRGRNSLVDPGRKNEETSFICSWGEQNLTPMHTQLQKERYNREALDLRWLWFLFHLRRSKLRQTEVQSAYYKEREKHLYKSLSAIFSGHVGVSRASSLWVTYYTSTAGRLARCHRRTQTQYTPMTHMARKPRREYRISAKIVS